MANLTNRICIRYREKSEDKNLAIEYFANKYKNIKYNEINDQFLYKGYTFDYFVSGLVVNSTEKMFMLVDCLDSNNWLFTFGSEKDRWNEFLEKTQQK